MPNETCNIGQRLKTVAAKLPNKRAVVFPHTRDKNGRVAYTHLTFSQIDRLSDEYAAGLKAYGITRGVKTLLMVKPSLDFFALVFALFKAGAVPVLIDPGMGVERLLHCIKAAQPEAMIGIPLAHLMRVLRPKFFKSVKYNVTVGRRFCWGGKTLAGIKRTDPDFTVTQTREDELAAILFTTGSTGPAKGVEYEHGMFEAQCELIQKTYDIDENDIDLPTFPLFSLFSVGLGMTAVIPDMDPTRPADVNPERIIEAVQNQGCTFSFGSPALWGKVSEYCAERNIKLPTLKKVLMAGAPVPPQTHRNLLEHVLGEGAETHTPYGATESLPACDMKGSVILAETFEKTEQGKGYCVGFPVESVEIEIIKLTDDDISTWDKSLILPQGEIGEIVVKGPSITKRYHLLPDQTKNAKITDGDVIRHRIGDLGYKDEKGRVWFCGRKAHRVETANGIMYSVCCEAIFNQHKDVKRTALVGLGNRPEQRPVIIVELFNKKSCDIEKGRIRAELLLLAMEQKITSEIQDIIFHDSFPVDIRHNAKINREQLTKWAQTII